MTTQAPPSTQAQASSPHLASALELLDELQAVDHGAGTDSQTKAVTATAQAILVLAEQVAAIRVLMVGDAMSRQANGQPAPANGQPAQQDKKPAKKRGWW